MNQRRRDGWRRGIGLAGLALVMGCGDGGSADDAAPDAGTAADARVDEDVTIGSNDVAWLLPLPTTTEELDLLLPLSAQGVGGPLLSPERFASIDVFPTADDPTLAYANWRIVAVRIDPCFPDLALLASAPATCRRQLRLVAQPVAFDGGVVEASDSTIHLFYDFDEAEFRTIATALIALQTATTGAAATPLGIHPTVASEGLAGATHAALKQLILAHAGVTPMSQMTFMHGTFASWEFGGVFIDGPEVAEQTPLAIPALDGDIRQTNGSDVNGIFSIDAASAVAIQLMDGLAGECDGGGVGNCPIVYPASSAAVQAALALTLEIDNPDSAFNPDTLDCVSCHVAGRARTRALGNELSIDGLPRYENPRNLTTIADELTAGSAPRVMRMFGHNGGGPVLGTRVVNEAAAVAGAVQTLLAE